MKLKVRFKMTLKHIHKGEVYSIMTWLDKNRNTFRGKVRLKLFFFCFCLDNKPLLYEYTHAHNKVWSNVKLFMLPDQRGEKLIPEVNLTQTLTLYSWDMLSSTWIIFVIKHSRGHIFFISNHLHKVASCYSELQPVNHVETPIRTPKSVRSRDTWKAWKSKAIWLTDSSSTKHKVQLNGTPSKILMVPKGNVKDHQSC